MQLQACRDYDWQSKTKQKFNDCEQVMNTDLPDDSMALFNGCIREKPET